MGLDKQNNSSSRPWEDKGSGVGGGGGGEGGLNKTFLALLASVWYKNRG